MERKRSAGSAIGAAGSGSDLAGRVRRRWGTHGGGGGGDEGNRQRGGAAARPAGEMLSSARATPTVLRLFARRAPLCSAAHEAHKAHKA
jgi:hypothetical protein